MREVSAAGGGDSIRKAEGGFMLPVELSSAPGEGISAGLGNPPVVNVPLGASVGKDVEEAQELPVNALRGRHDARQEGVCGARPVGIGLAIPCRLGGRRSR